MARVYLAGSLRNPAIPKTAEALREAGHETVDHWFAGGEHADAEWRRYFEARGISYPDAVYSPFVENIVDFDRRWMEWAEAVVLVLPAGIDGHIELTWAASRGKLPIIYAPSGFDRWGAMIRLIEPRFALDLDGVLAALEEV